MIGSLRGTLTERSGTEVLIEVAGVGYRVVMSPTGSATVGEVGSEVFVQVHHHIREGSQTLYGFRNRDELVCFRALIGAHGVGPSLALAILSVHDPAGLVRVLADDDVESLCLVPGVGKKTAARLLVELKSRLDVPELDLTSWGGAPSPASGSPLGDVREALVNLGYGADEVSGVLREMPDGGDVSALLREALQRLAVG